MRFGTPGQGMVEAGELVVQQRGLEDHFGRFDSPYVELVQYVGSIHEREDIIRKATSKFGPQVGVDVAHHEVDLLLCIWVHGLPFWNHPADECMVVLAGSLLLALAGIAVEDLDVNLVGFSGNAKTISMFGRTKKPNRFLVSEPVRLQAKDGTRTRDIHLGKVELYH